MSVEFCPKSLRSKSPSSVRGAMDSSLNIPIVSAPIKSFGRANVTKANIAPECDCLAKWPEYWPRPLVVDRRTQPFLPWSHSASFSRWSNRLYNFQSPGAAGQPKYAQRSGRQIIFAIRTCRRRCQVIPRRQVGSVTYLEIVVRLRGSGNKNQLSGLPF